MKSPAGLGQVTLGGVQTPPLCAGVSRAAGACAQAHTMSVHAPRSAASAVQGAWPASMQITGSQAVASCFVALFCALSCTTNMASELWGLYARVAITGSR